MKYITQKISLAVLCLTLSPSLWAIGTSAGTDITNTATATYNSGTATGLTEDSNPVTTTVNELLDVSVLWQDTSNIIVSPGDTNQVLTFLITNTGNGSDTYSLSGLSTLTGDQFDPTLVDIFLDANDNGVYDSGTDTLYAPGVNDPVLDANDPLTNDLAVFVVNDIPSPLVDADLGNSQLTATSTLASGTDAPGTVLGSGAGDMSTEAVVGDSNATAADIGIYVVSNVVVSVVKSASVVDQFGGSEPVPGAVITYSIAVTVTSTGTASSLVVTDLVPVDTTYNTGTLTLNSGAPFTEVADADDGEVSGAPGAETVTVTLGDLTSTSPVQTITFDVTIN